MYVNSIHVTTQATNQEENLRLENPAQLTRTEPVIHCSMQVIINCRKYQLLIN